MVRKLLNASDVVRFSDPDSALQLLAEANAIYKRNGDAKGMLDYYAHVQYIYSDIMPNAAMSRKYVDSIVQLTSLPGNESLKYKARCAFGDYYFSIERNYPKAVSYYVEALKMQPRPIDSIFFLNITGVLAQIYFEQDNMEAASNYYEPLLQRVISRPDAPEKVAVLINGFCFANRKTTAGRTRARKYIFAAKDIAERLQDSSINNLLYTNLASYYQELGNGDSSVFFARKAVLNAAGDKDNINSILPALEIMGYFYAQRGDLKALKQILNQIESDGYVATFKRDKFEGQYYNLKYMLAKQNGDNSAALNALEKRAEVDSQISAIIKQKELLDHDKEVKKLSAEKTIADKNNQLERHQLYTLGLVICAVLLVLLVLMSFMYWRNRQKLETEKWMDLQRRKEYESQKKLLEERSRIAGEMHDDLGTTLTSTMMAVEMIKLKPGEPAPLAMIDRSASQLSDQINEIIWNMNVKNDNLESLSDYILRFASNFLKEAGITLSWNEDLAEKNVQVSGQQRRNLFLCVKELINNIVKHAGATKVQLGIKYHNGILTIDISDNGTGMEGSSASTAGSGNGLLNIRKRVEDMNGQITWSAPPERGTHVHMFVPLSNKPILS
jgi:two-component system sensor histidine kinase DesK